LAANPEAMTEQSIFGEDFVKPEEKQYNTLNLGPTHPATHGVFQNILQMDGEIIMSAEPTIGYIHRAFEKLAERRPFYQVTPITDRLNYCSAPINNIGWHMTVEKLIGVEIPKRVQYMRVIIMELARIADHLICIDKFLTVFSPPTARRGDAQT
jgi:NADH-quinone oxidoreductase subunit D